MVEDPLGAVFCLRKQVLRRMHSDSLEPHADLLQLADLSQETLLHTVRQRFGDNKIYSSVGAPILVAVNPYCQLGLYTPEIQRFYRNLRKEEMDGAEPHVFKTAEICFRNVVEGHSQNIIITGESGAGKTESTKLMLAYLAGRVKAEESVSESTWPESGGEILQKKIPDNENITNSESQHINKSSLLQERILKANPVLEAFGNAQTVQNDNSSRFGKFIEISFGRSDNFGGICKTGKIKILSARINNYLLENSRVTVQSAGERNYHIFYCLLARACSDSEFASKFEVPELPVRCVNFRDAESNEENNLDEKSSSAWVSFRLKQAQELDLNFKELGFFDNQISNIYQAISGLMHLSNLEISEISGKALIDDLESHLSTTARLWGVERTKLERLVVCKSFKDPSTKRYVDVPLDAERARVNLETLMKVVYDALFDWLVGKVNDAISGGESMEVGACKVDFFLFN